jgi:hypothetical protein
MIQNGMMKTDGYLGGNTTWFSGQYTYYYWFDGGFDCFLQEWLQEDYGPITVAERLTFTTVSNNVNNQSSNFSTGFGTETASVNLDGGRQVCVGSRTDFNITVNFNLPPGAQSIFHPDSRTFVSDSEDQQFQYLSFSFEDVSYSLRKGKMIINLRRVRPTASDNSIRIRITGGLQAGGSYSGNAKVTFTCP